MVENKNRNDQELKYLEDKQQLLVISQLVKEGLLTIQAKMYIWVKTIHYMQKLMELLLSERKKITDHTFLLFLSRHSQQHFKILNVQTKFGRFFYVLFCTFTRMTFLYNFITQLTYFFLRIYAIFNKKMKLFVSGREDTFQHLSSIKKEDRTIWFHVASLGEFEQAIPCLLYTSPSPRDRTRSRMPSSA